MSRMKHQHTGSVDSLQGVIMKYDRIRSNAESFFTGFVGGASSIVAAHPFDTIKTRLQVFSVYKGMTDCVGKTLHHEGFRGFYKGMAFPLVSASLYNSMVFGSFHFFQDTICIFKYDDVRHPPTTSDQFLAAMATGAASVAIGSPIDLVKIRLQTQTDQKPSVKLSLANTDSSVAKTLPAQLKKYHGPIDCIRDIYRVHGVRGLYHGSFAMVLRDIPGYAFYLVPYTIMREHFKNNEKETKLEGLLISAFAGGLSGVLSWGITHPLDTVKSRIQAEIDAKTRKYKGTFHCFRTIYREEGISPFFRGITLNALRGFPQSAALFCGVELTMQLLAGDR